MRYQFFYFDLGNVLVHFSHETACRQLGELLGVTSQRIREYVFEGGLQHAYESGLISDSQFCEQIRRQCPAKSTDTEILQAASQIFWGNPDIWPVVTKVRRAGLRTGILSNTCPAHWNFVCQEILAGQQSLFDECVLSFEVRSMKPDSKIYSEAVVRSGVAPEAILFVDDREENVAGALQAGMNAHLFSSVESLRDWLHTNKVF